MKPQKPKTAGPFSLAGGLASLMLALPGSSQVGGEYEIARSTVDGGGGSSAGGEYSVTGTIGQWDASVRTLVGGEYKVTGGFWAAPGDNIKPDVIFANGFESG